MGLDDPSSYIFQVSLNMMSYVWQIKLVCTNEFKLDVWICPIYTCLLYCLYLQSSWSFIFSLYVLFKCYIRCLDVHSIHRFHSIVLSLSLQSSWRHRRGERAEGEVWPVVPAVWLPGPPRARLTPQALVPRALPARHSTRLLRAVRQQLCKPGGGHRHHRGTPSHQPPGHLLPHTLPTGKLMGNIHC